MESDGRGHVLTKISCSLSTPPSYQHKPMVPVWVDGALKRALSIDANARYSSMSEFIADLKHPNPLYLRMDQKPLMERHPERFWQCVSACLLVVILVLLLR